MAKDNKGLTAMPRNLPVRRVYFIHGLAVAILVAVTGLTNRPVYAQQQGVYCVRCTAPDANYLCSLPQDVVGVSGNALKLFCIERASKELGHEFCSIQKNAVACPDVKQSFEFSQPVTAEGDYRPSEAAQKEGTGAPQVLRPDANPPADTQVGAVAPADGVGPDAAEEDEKKEKKAPDTLIEFTSQAARDARQGMKNASKMVNSAVKKTGQGIKGVAEKTGGYLKDAGKSTWKCLGSLFTNC